MSPRSHGAVTSPWDHCQALGVAYCRFLGRCVCIPVGERPPLLPIRPRGPRQEAECEVAQGSVLPTVKRDTFISTSTVAPHQGCVFMKVEASLLAPERVSIPKEKAPMPQRTAVGTYRTGGLDVIQKEAWSFYRTSSSVRLCWELEEPKGPKGNMLGARRT